MPGQPRNVELLWGHRAEPRRGPKPVLTLDRIVTTAIAVADAEGLSTLSMQRIAAELGFTKMSLYRHVPGKDELVALMLDSALGAAPDLSQQVGWRAQLRAWTITVYDRMRDHPWTVLAAVGGRVVGPNELAWIEAGLAALAATPLDGGQRLDVIATLAIHARGQVQVAPQPDNRPEAEMNAAMSSILATHGARYPAVLAAFTDVRASHTQDEGFEFGLELILDGLAARTARTTE